MPFSDETVHSKIIQQGQGMNSAPSFFDIYLGIASTKYKFDRAIASQAVFPEAFLHTSRGRLSDQCPVSLSF